MCVLISGPGIVNCKLRSAATLLFTPEGLSHFTQQGKKHQVHLQSTEDMAIVPTFHLDSYRSAVDLSYPERSQQANKKIPSAALQALSSLFATQRPYDIESI